MFCEFQILFSYLVLVQFFFYLFMNIFKLLIVVFILFLELPVSVSQPYLPNPAVQDVEQKRASPNVKMQAMASGNLEFFSASGSQLSKSQSPIINMAANQLNQSQSRLSPLLSVDLQQLPSLSTSTGPVITMSSVSTNVTTVPTTAENIPVSQYNSVFQSGFSQVTDAARDKQIDVCICFYLYI